MKLLLSLIGVTSATTTELRYCGQIKGHSGLLTDELNLSEQESCLYHIELDQPPNDEFHLELKQASLQPCSVSEMYIHQDGEVYGPYCDPETVRHRRSGWSGINQKWSGPSLASKPFDVIYTGHGLKFSFDFEFDMAPGAPRTKSLSFGSNQEKFTTSAYAMKEQILSQINQGKPVAIKPIASGKPVYKPLAQKPKPINTTNYNTYPTVHPGMTFRPTAKPYFKPTFKPAQSAFDNKENILSAVAPAVLPKPEKPYSGFQSALETKETIMQSIHVQDNSAYDEKEQIFALAENLGLNYQVANHETTEHEKLTSTTTTTSPPTSGPTPTSGTINLELIDQILEQSKPEQSEQQFVYQGYNMESYLNTDSTPEKDNLMEILATTTVFDESVTYRLDTSTIQPIRLEIESTTPAPPVKQNLKPLPDREINFVFGNRPRPGAPIINLAQIPSSPVDPKPVPHLPKPQMPDVKQEPVAPLDHTINFGMQRPNPIGSKMLLDTMPIVHPVPHLPQGPLETKLVIATTPEVVLKSTTEAKETLQSTTEKYETSTETTMLTTDSTKAQMEIKPLLRESVEQARIKLASLLYEINQDLSIEELISGVKLINLKHLDVHSIERLSENRRNGIHSRIQKKLEKQRTMVQEKKAKEEARLKQEEKRKQRRKERKSKD